MAGNSVERTQDTAPSHSEIEVAAHHPRPVYNPDAPSEQWGWHGSWREFAPRGRTLLLGLFTVVIFALLIGNHRSHVEDYYLVVIGILMIVWIVRSQLATNRQRRRKP